MRISNIYTLKIRFMSFYFIFCCIYIYILLISNAFNYIKRITTSSSVWLIQHSHYFPTFNIGVLSTTVSDIFVFTQEQESFEKGVYGCTSGKFFFLFLFCDDL